MLIDFDPAKNQSNFLKHGVHLAEATRFEWDTALIWPDLRFAENETRYGALGYIGLRLYFVAFVCRSDYRRIISLRKANSREEQRYAET